MSHHNHEEHNGDDHHDHVPAVATEIVPENSFEDHSLVGLIVLCGAALMIGMVSWMQIEQPSGGGHHGSSSETHSHDSSSHSHDGAEHSHH